MPFTDLALTTMDDKPGVFRVAYDVVYYYQHKGKMLTYTVVKGRETDLASIPIGLRFLFSRTGRSRKPAVFHDDMYFRKWKTRKACDKMFRRMLIERGVGQVKAWFYYQGVRKFGWTRGKW